MEKELDRFALRRLEAVKNRTTEWDKFGLEKAKLAFSKRIQNVLNKIEIPNIIDIKSTFITGKVGSGKTIKAVLIMLNFIKSAYIEKFQWNGGAFITVPELLFKFKESYSKKNDYVDLRTKAEDDYYSDEDEYKKEEILKTEFELVQYYSDIDFLVLDDFGVESTTDWSFQLLYVIINRRYENEKITIFTSNYELPELAEKLGDERITSRIKQMCKVVKTKDVNYREL